MIPEGIKREHVLRALAEIDRDGVPRGRASRDFDLVAQTKRYPPKYAVAVAARIATGHQPSPDDFGGGDETNMFLRRLGFIVTAKGAPPAVSGLARIAVISIRAASRPDEDRALREAFAAAFAEHVGSRIALLAGVGDHWSRDERRVADVAKANGAAVLFEAIRAEGARGRAFSPGRGFAPQSIKQVLATSKQANASPHLVDELLAECAPGGARTFELAGLMVGLLVCGENNVLVNEQSADNRCAGVRHHPKASLFDHVAVVHDGAHTPMGNWKKLNARFEWLSARGPVVTYCTNNRGKVWGSWGRCVRVYADGQMIADGRGVRVETSGVRVVGDDVRDGFRAVTFDCAPPT